MGQKTGHMYEMKELGEAGPENNTKDDVIPGKSKEKQRCTASLGIKMFTFFGCILIALMGTQNQYFSGSLRMFEKQFGLTSAQTGLMRGMENLSGLVMVIVLGYCGDVFNKARMLGYCTLLSGTCTILMSLPHFVSIGNLPKLNATINISLSKDDILCEFLLTNNTKCATEEVERHVANSQMAFWIFCIVRFVLGLSATSHTNLTMAYIHSNAPPKLAAFLIGTSSIFPNDIEIRVTNDEINN